MVVSTIHITIYTIHNVNQNSIQHLNIIENWFPDYLNTVKQVHFENENIFLAAATVGVIKEELIYGGVHVQSINSY